MEGVNSRLLAKRTNTLFFYSPYNFLRNLTADLQSQLFGSGRFGRFPISSHDKVFTYHQAEKELVQLLYTELPWDSDFFGVPTFKLQTALFDPNTAIEDRIEAVHAWQKELADTSSFYCFGEIPVEDTDLLQTLTASGWRLIETRLLFYHDQLDNFNHPRVAVRGARLEEAEHVGQIAAKARNLYDRFHADAWFSNEQADAFLACYASSAVKGYCDIVLIPDEDGVSIDSFLAINDLSEDSDKLGVKLSRVVLTAVGPQNRGWHIQLVSETLHRARERQVDYVLMTTQATNRAVFRTCEKLGFKLGGSTQVVAFHHHVQ